MQLGTINCPACGRKTVYQDKIFPHLLSISQGNCPASNKVLSPEKLIKYGYEEHKEESQRNG